jgi:hypothetical protein
MLSTMLSLLLRCGLSNICSIDGKDMHHGHDVSTCACIGEGKKFLGECRHVITPKTARECTALTHTTLCGLDFDMRYGRSGLEPCRSKWSVLREGQGVEASLRLRMKTLQRDTSVHIRGYAFACRRGRGSDGRAMLRAPEDGVSRCWCSGVGSWE